MLNRGRFQLLSGNAVYSWDDLYRNFSYAFGQINLAQRNYHDVLILGLGLGSVPFILERTYKRDYRYVAVEWDETVAELAYRYTLSRLKSPVEVITADAEMFVQICEEQFDLIIVDIFEDDLVPPQFEDPDFLRDCDELLLPGGMLLFNRLHGEHKDIVSAERFYNHTFTKVFPNARYIDTQGNWIMVYEKT